MFQNTTVFDTTQSANTAYIRQCVGADQKRNVFHQRDLFGTLSLGCLAQGLLGNVVAYEDVVPLGLLVGLVKTEKSP